MDKLKNNNGRIIPLGKTQVNFNLDNTILEKVKDLAFWENVTQSDIYNKSVLKFLELYEKKHGKIKTRLVGKGLDTI
jgi:hypothetical protein